MIKNPSVWRAFLPLLIIFVISNLVFIGAVSLLEKMNIRQEVALAGNLIIFLATAISFYLYHKSLMNNRVQVFLRMIYGGMFVKMFTCLIAAFVYIMIAGKQVNKAGIFLCMFLYFVYSFTEIAILLKISKSPKDAKA